MYELFEGDYKALLESIQRNVADYFKRNNLNAAIIGVSGGIDSALVAAIVAKTKESGLLPQDFMLHGYSLPIGSNTDEEISRAENVGKSYCDTFHEVDLWEVATEFGHAIDVAEKQPFFQDKWNKSIKKKIRFGNIKARVRMIFLYDMAQAYNGLVLSSDNLTEYNLGFWTLHGGVGDFGPIQDLWKTEVYRLAEYIGDSCLLECVEAVPTDGLGITDSDIDQLLPDWKGTPREGYEEIDRILIHQTLTGGKYSEEELKDRPILKRHFETEFKRNNPCKAPRVVLVMNRMKYVPF